MSKTFGDGVKKRSSDSKRAPLEKALIRRGWWPSDDGWRHKALEWPWPPYQALQLQSEADRGLEGLIYEDLREKKS
jgi:hypothetical protein